MAPTKIDDEINHHDYNGLFGFQGHLFTQWQTWGAPKKGLEIRLFGTFRNSERSNFSLKKRHTFS